MEPYIVWTHIVFFSIWLGANLFCLAIFLPASRPLSPEARWQARARGSRGLNATAAISAPLVVISGVAAFLLPGVGSTTVLTWGHWSIIGSKFILTLVMVINHWRQAFRYAPSGTSQENEGMQASDSREVAWKAWVRLLTLNVVLGFFVFFLGLDRA